MHHKLWTAALVLGATVGPAARADVITLTTTHPVGTPLTMAENSVSSTDTVRIVNLNPPADAMTGWFITLATGSPPHPPGYIFSQSFIGISVTNTGGTLRAFDEDNNLAGTQVPQAGASLLDLTYQASPVASGMFGIYALPGAANTGWTDQNAAPQFFQNVPSGGGSPVLIGQVFVVPE